MLKNAHSMSWVEIGAMGLPFLESPSNSASPWCAPFFFGLPQLLCNGFAQCGGGDSTISDGRRNFFDNQFGAGREWSE